VYDNLGAQAVRTLDTAINGDVQGHPSWTTRTDVHSTLPFIDYLDNVPQARQRYMSGDMSHRYRNGGANRQKRMFDPFRRPGHRDPRESAQRVVPASPKAGARHPDARARRAREAQDGRRNFTEAWPFGRPVSGAMNQG